VRSPFAKTKVLTKHLNLDLKLCLVKTTGKDSESYTLDLK